MKRLAHRVALCALLLVASVLVARTASGQAPQEAETQQTDIARARARVLFLRGSELAGENRWRDALAAFEQAAQLYPHPRTSFNIGFCERALGRHARALRAVRDALAIDTAKGESTLTAEERADAMTIIDEALERVARLAIEISPTTATIAIDGRPIERNGSEPLFLAGTRKAGEAERVPAARFTVLIDPGKHDVVVAAGGQRRTVEVSLAPAERAPLTLAISAPAVGEPALPGDAGVDLRIVAAVGFGVVGLAGLGTGAGLAVHARSLQDDAEAACPDRTQCRDNEGFELSDEATRYANGATLAFVLGGAALAAGGVLALVVGLDDDDNIAGDSVSFGVGSVAVRF